MNRVQLTLHVGPIYERSRDKYAVKYILIPFDSITFHVPRGSAIEEQNNKRPTAGRTIKGLVNERVVLYPSNDILGRRGCVEMLPLLSDQEKDFLRRRENMLVAEDVSGELINLYGE